MNFLASNIIRGEDMNYKDMIDVMYKQAAEDEEEGFGYTKGGMILGGGMAAGSSIKNRMGNKYSNMSNIRGDFNNSIQRRVDKANSKAQKAEIKNFKMNNDRSKWKDGISEIKQKPGKFNMKGVAPEKVKFGERFGKFTHSLGNPGAFGWKGMAAKVGLGIAGGAAVGKGLEYIDNKTKQASETIDELYKEAQADIHCERCGYDGKPNYNGTCPECGLTLGKYEHLSDRQSEGHAHQSNVEDVTVNDMIEEAKNDEWN